MRVFHWFNKNQMAKLVTATCGPTAHFLKEVFNKIYTNQDKIFQLSVAGFLKVSNHSPSFIYFLVGWLKIYNYFGVKTKIFQKNVSLVHM